MDNNRNITYSDIVKGMDNSRNLTPSDKDDIIHDIASSMRAGMFGDSISCDVISLKQIILETDNNIDDAKNKFYSTKDMDVCSHLKQLCAKQKDNLVNYVKLCNNKLVLKNEDIDLILDQCEQFEKNYRHQMYDDDGLTQIIAMLNKMMED